MSPRDTLSKPVEQQSYLPVKVAANSSHGQSTGYSRLSGFIFSQRSIQHFVFSKKCEGYPERNSVHKMYTNLFRIRLTPVIFCMTRQSNYWFGYLELTGRLERGNTVSNHSLVFEKHSLTKVFNRGAIIIEDCDNTWSEHLQGRYVGREDTECTSKCGYIDLLHTGLSEKHLASGDKRMRRYRHWHVSSTATVQH